MLGHIDTSKFAYGFSKRWNSSRSYFYFVNLSCSIFSICMFVLTSLDPPWFLFFICAYWNLKWVSASYGLRTFLLELGTEFILSSKLYNILLLLWSPLLPCTILSFSFFVSLLVLFFFYPLGKIKFLLYSTICLLYIFTSTDNTLKKTYNHANLFEAKSASFGPSCFLLLFMGLPWS